MTLTIVPIEPDTKPPRKPRARKPRKLAPRPNGRPKKVAPLTRPDGSAAIIGRLVAIIDQGVPVVEWPGALLPPGSPVHPANVWAFAPHEPR